MKTANNKIPVSSVFNDSEGLYRTTGWRCLVRRPHYSARLMRFGARGPSEFATEMPSACALTEIAWEDAVQGLGLAGFVYRRVREKQGNAVYRQRVLQTVTSLRVVSLVFRGHSLLQITNINPQQEATLSLWKKLAPKESGGNGV